jgi:hypothetical protein
LKFFISIFIGVTICLQTLYGQSNNPENEISESLDAYKTRYIQEKLFVHTDQDMYITKEILWFRVYYTDAIFQHPGELSRIAYLEILDRDNVPVLQQKVSLKPGESNGSILLPSKLETGYYRLRVYTNWMKNFDPLYFFEKKLLIINPQQQQSDNTTKTNSRVDIQFFPEGGNLVENVKSKVGFRITDAFGNGLLGNGILLDSKDDTILSFSPQHLGLGNFEFTPKSNTTYKAKVFIRGTEITKSLPTIYTSGYVLNISRNSEDEIIARVRVSPDLDQRKIFLFVNGQHSHLPLMEGQLNQNTAIFTVKEHLLDEGLSQFTLFDKDAQPMCERLFFRYPADTLSISVDLNSDYKTRKKVDINLNIIKKDSLALKDADLSISVYQVDSNVGPENAEISEYLQLTSELSNVENPSFYFRPEDKSRSQDMDNLMLTHGWRRYVWAAINAQTFSTPKFLPEHDTHNITGKLYNEKNEPVAGEKVYLSVPSERTLFRATTSGSDGRINFSMKDFYGSTELVVQTRQNPENHNHVEIDNPFFDKYPENKLPEFNPSRTSMADMADRSLYSQVPRIYEESMLNRFHEQKADTNPFYVVPDEKYLLDDYTRFMTMEEVLREYVKSVNVVRKGDRFQLYAVDYSTENPFPKPPLILIDGVPFFDANELFQQDPKKIKRIDLINHEYVFGTEHYSGIVNLTTYHGNLDGIQLNSHATVLDYPGIPLQREFFSPEYTTEQQIKSKMPDFRYLLYWSPEFHVTEGGKDKISFYTSDLAGNYIVKIQGLSPNGQPVTKTAFFSVHK